jgi:hypothetical protein
MKNKVLFIILCLFVLRLNVFGLEANMTISCPTNGKVNDNITCTIKGNASSGEVSSLSATIELSSNLQFVSFNTSSIWEGNADNGVIDLYTDSNKTGNFDIGTLTVKINNNTTNPAVVTIKSIIFYDKNFLPKNVSNVSSNINIQSDVNTLSALSISVGTLSPAFNPSTLTYSATVPENTTSITIDATKSDSKSSISGAGTKTLNYGLNQLKVIVTSESGVSKTYILNITRTDNRSSNNNLKSLEVENTKITFNKTRTEYTDAVSNKVEKIVIKAVAEDDKATVTGTGTYDLVVGLNSFVITVTAENGSKKEYKININREEILEEDYKKENKLKSLSVDGIELNFDKDVLEYYLNVSDNVSSIKLNYETINKDEKVEIVGSTELEYGKNTIKIKVTALNKDVLEYVLVVNRRKDENIIKYKEEDILSAINNNTKNIVVIFNKDVKDKIVSYNVIKSLIEKKVSIKYEIVDNKGNVLYSVTIDGNKINNVNSYVDLHLDFENENIEKKLNKKDKYIILDFLREEIIEGSIKYQIHQNIFTDETLYLYDSNFNYIDDIIVKDGVITLELSNVKDYVLLENKVSSFNILYVIIPVVGLLIIGIIVYLLIIKKKIRFKVKKIVEEKIEEVKDLSQ